MNYIDIILIFVIGIFLSYRKYNKIITPLGVFSLCWLFVVLIHSFDLVGYYKLNELTLVCIRFMVIFFYIGSFIGDMYKIRIVKQDITITYEYYLKRYLLFLKMFSILGIIGFTLYLIFHKNEINSYNGVVRFSRSGEGIYRPIREYIYTIAMPCLMVVLLVSATLHARVNKIILMNKQKIKFELIVLICVSCVLLIIYDMITLGRIYLFYTLSVFLSAYFITTNVGKNVWSFRFIFKILIVALVFLMFFYKITVVRDIADGYNALLSILMYYSGALAYFNTIVLDIKQYEYGRMVMGGFESFLRSIDFVPVIRDYIPNLPISLEDQQIMFDVGFDVRYNAFGSLMMDAYKDAGIFGISILSMFIGIISSFLYRNIISCSKPLLLSFCTLSGVWIIWSPLCWSGGFYETGKIFVWLLVLDYISTKYKMKSLKTVFN